MFISLIQLIPLFVESDHDILPILGFVYSEQMTSLTFCLFVSFRLKKEFARSSFVFFYRPLRRFDPRQRIVQTPLLLLRKDKKPTGDIRPTSAS